jgi:hypothetical protein
MGGRRDTCDATYRDARCDVTYRDARGKATYRDARCNARRFALERCGAPRLRAVHQGCGRCTALFECIAPDGSI